MLAHLPTPVEPMDRLGKALGFEPGALWVKRDDCTGLAGGGNKARKLEYLCAEALAQGCDTLVTGGGPQSNHARMTAAAANKLGMSCTIVLAADESPPVGNVVLDVVLGADIVWAGPLGYRATEAAIEAAYARLAADGRRPYMMPIGGATVLGACGYVDGADELIGQVPDLDLVVVAGGSGGTHAGLVAGLGDHANVLGVNVGARKDLAEAVSLKATEAAAMTGRPAPRGTVQVDDSCIGEGYGVGTAEGRDAIERTARLEGLILDPVYTGKAMAGLIAARREDRIRADQRVVFLHTGGMPALFADAHGSSLA